MTTLYKNPDGTIGANGDGAPMLAPTQEAFEDCCCGCPGCVITLYIEDQQCSFTEKDVTVVLTGYLCYTIVGAADCDGANQAINIYATGDTTVCVDYAWQNPIAVCDTRIQPRVNGVIETWDSTAVLLLEGESDTITLDSGDRLQIFSNILNGCTNGDHDDHGGRATWTVGECPECP